MNSRVVAGVTMPRILYKKILINRLIKIKNYFLCFVWLHRFHWSRVNVRAGCCRPWKARYSTGHGMHVYGMRVVAKGVGGKGCIFRCVMTGGHRQGFLLIVHYCAVTGVQYAVTGFQYGRCITLARRCEWLSHARRFVQDLARNVLWSSLHCIVVHFVCV